MNQSVSSRSRDDELMPYARALIPPGTQATSSLSLRSLSVNELRPHPRYRELCGPIPEMTLFALSEQGEVLFEEPLVVDDSGTIVDGFKRWMLAKRQQRSHLLCLEYSSNSDEDTFRLLVERQLRKPQALSPYMRILLALELEPTLRKRAKEQQRIGGRENGSSNLAKANPVDVRSEIAKMAGVSSGNVTEVKQILERACPELMEELRRDEISIHRAHIWSSQPKGRQRELLDEWRDQKGILSTIDKLLSRHSKKPSEPPLELSHLAQILAANSAALDGVKVHIIKGNGRMLYLSRGLVKYLRATGKQGQHSIGMNSDI